jgi:hypothetical protein
MTGENVQQEQNGRRCRQCHRDYMREYRARG